MNDDVIRINQGSIPTFDGSPQRFHMWWTKFRAFAMLSGFSEAIQEDPDPMLPTSSSSEIDEDTDEGKKQKIAKKRNDLAISSFTIAFTKEGIIRLVSKSKTKEWPDGAAYLIVRMMMKKYRPTDMMSKVEMRQKLNKVVMKKGSDPAILFETLAEIEDKYDGSVDEADLIAIVLDAATDEYQSVLTAEESARGSKLTLLDLELIMGQHYRRLSKRRTVRQVEENEVLLAGFNGACFNCGKRGHRANKCPERERHNDNGEKKVSKTCINCGKRGHLAKDCWFKDSNKSRRPKDFRNQNREAAAVGIDKTVTRDISEEYLLGTMDTDQINSPDIWIADTAATVHMTPYRMGLENIKKTDGEAITMGNGSTETVTEVADVTGEIECKGKMIQIRIKDVTVLKNGSFNLFSVSQALKKGWILEGDKDKVVIKKGKLEIKFDIKIKTTKGVLFATKIERNREFCGAVDSQTIVKVTEHQAHQMLGHMSMVRTRQIASMLQWRLTDKMGVCASCAEGKARQKNISTKTKRNTNVENSGRLHIDLSSIKHSESLEPEQITKPYWLIIVDERTQMKFSEFFSHKNAMIEPTCQQLIEWINSGKNVKIIRCDNAGENRALEKRLKSSEWRAQIDFEYTGRDTPQRNSLAEVSFHTLASRGRAIMNDANIPRHLRYLLWREAFQTATLLDGLTIIEINGVSNSRYMHWNGTNPVFAKQLRTWGEAGVVKLFNKRTSKIFDRGITCMFVGYPKSHASDTYRMWDPRSQRVHTTRDVTWLKKMYFSKVGPTNDVEYIQTYQEESVDDNYENDSDKEDSNSVSDDNDNLIEIPNEEVENDNSGEEVRTTRSGRVIWIPKKYRKDFLMTGADKAEAILIGAGLGEGISNTMELHVKNYKQAMASEDKDKWLKAIEEEHNRMTNHGVWTAVDRSTVSGNGKILTTTWAMKKKANGTYRARVNARGYEQVKGIHYDESSTAAPVTNDTTIRIIYVLAILAGWSPYVIDVQGAFLNGRFGENEHLYLEIPDGFENFYDKTKVLKLNRTIYGLKQSAQAFWSELLKAFKTMEFKRSDGDPCCYFKKVDNRLVVCLSWVDDCLFLGRRDDVIMAADEMKLYFECDDIGFTDTYVGCKITMNKEMKTVRFEQPVMIKSLVDEFGISGKTMKIPATHGTVLQPGEVKDELKGKEKKGIKLE
jgi:hypothetical protein